MSHPGLESVRRRIREAALAAGRDPAGITLIAVSKTFAAAGIEPVISAGQRVFGENRVQEAKAKWPELKRKKPDLELHLIGPLQSNKAGDAVALFDAIHTIDRPKIAEAIAAEIARQGSRPQLFIQINTGDEQQKSGIAPDEADSFIAHCRDRSGLAIAGLMCIPPLEEDAAPSLRTAARDRQPQSAFRTEHGHERRFRDGDQLRRHPCAGRLGDFRRTRRLAPDRPCGFRVRSSARIFRMSLSETAMQPAVGACHRPDERRWRCQPPWMRGRSLWREHDDNIIETIGAPQISWLAA